MSENLICSFQKWSIKFCGSLCISACGSDVKYGSTLVYANIPANCVYFFLLGTRVPTTICTIRQSCVPTHEHFSNKTITLEILFLWEHRNDLVSRGIEWMNVFWLFHNHIKFVERKRKKKRWK